MSIYPEPDQSGEVNPPTFAGSRAMMLIYSQRIGDRYQAKEMRVVLVR